MFWSVYVMDIFGLKTILYRLCVMKRCIIIHKMKILANSASKKVKKQDFINVPSTGHGPFGQAHRDLCSHWTWCLPILWYLKSNIDLFLEYFYDSKHYLVSLHLWSDNKLNLLSSKKSTVDQLTSCSCDAYSTNINGRCVGVSRVGHIKHVFRHIVHPFLNILQQISTIFLFLWCWFFFAAVTM